VTVVTAYLQHLCYGQAGEGLYRRRPPMALAWMALARFKGFVRQASYCWYEIDHFGIH